MGFIPNILVCPLDWGIGHATRCVPVIRELLKHPVRIIIGADARPLAFLRNEFPDLEFFRFPGYWFSYPEKGSMTFSIALSAPAILYGIFHEHRLLRKIIRERNIHGVISDNRFGLWTNEVPCVYITHQVRVRTSKSLFFLENVLFRLNRYFISRYDECWIPDQPGCDSLSGDLSCDAEGMTNTVYTGHLSRFKGLYRSLPGSPGKQFDLLFLISGPEPQRSVFERKIIEQVRNSPYTAAILRGVPEKSAGSWMTERIYIVNHADTATIAELIRSSEKIICRSGYSTIMDLSAMGRTALLVPTPGQTEQEYLADYLSAVRGFATMTQDDFNLDNIASLSLKSNFEYSPDPGLLKSNVENFIGRVISGKQ